MLSYSIDVPVHILVYAAGFARCPRVLFRLISLTLYSQLGRHNLFEQQQKRVLFTP
jgi:hypothetical protein